MFVLACIRKDGTGGLSIFCPSDMQLGTIAHPDGHSKKENQLLSALIHMMLILLGLPYASG